MCCMREKGGAYFLMYWRIRRLGYASSAQHSAHNVGLMKRSPTYALTTFFSQVGRVKPALFLRRLYRAGFPCRAHAVTQAKAIAMCASEPILLKIQSITSYIKCGATFD